jgi:hypothetical protein
VLEESDATMTTNSYIVLKTLSTDSTATAQIMVKYVAIFDNLFTKYDCNNTAYVIHVQWKQLTNYSAAKNCPT